MFLYVGLAISVVMIANLVAWALGWTKRDWLASWGRYRQIADILMWAPILLLIAIESGVQRSGRVALVLAVAAVILGTATQIVRHRIAGRQPREPNAREN